MRTTIEIQPEHRARLLELAAARGKKGLSELAAEAFGEYLNAQGKRKASLKRALALKGSLSEMQAASLLTQTRRIRSRWR